MADNSSPDPTEQVLKAFPGMNYEQQVGLLGADQSIWPPDVQLAAGPSSLLEAVNSNLSIWSSSGKLLTTYDLNTLFQVPAGYAFADPRVTYDHGSGRFFLTGWSSDAVNNSQMYLAVSTSSDPGGQWYVYTLVTNTEEISYDQPKVGFSADKIVIAWADYDASSTFFGEELWILDKAQAIAGSPPAYLQVTPDPNRFGMVPSAEPNPTSLAYVVYNNADPNLSENETCENNQGQSQYCPTVGFISIAGTPSLTNVNLSYYAGELPAIDSTSYPPDAVQPSGPPIATNDDRFLSAVWQSDVLWTAGNDACIPANDEFWHSCLRLVQLSTSGGTPSVLQSFDVGLADTDLYYPAVTVDASGNLFVVFSLSSPSQFASAGTVTQAVGAPAYKISTVLMLQTGLGVANNCGLVCISGGTSLNRWGDYSAAATDPTNPLNVWVAAEYAGSAIDPLDWASGINQVSLTTPTPTATPTLTSTPSPTKTSTRTNTPSPTFTLVPSCSASPTQTISPEVTASATPISSPMPTASATPTLTASPTSTRTSRLRRTPSPTLTRTPSRTPTSVPSETATVSPTASATATTSATATRTATPVGQCATSTPTATATPVVVQVTPGVATQVSTTIGGNKVSVDVPGGSSIAEVVVSAPPTPITIAPSVPAYQALAGDAIVVSALDIHGQPIVQLNSPVTVAIHFSPLPGVNAALAVIYTASPTDGSAQALPTTILVNGDGSYTASAMTTHLSPFAIFAPGVLTPVPRLYLPVTPG